MYCVFHVTYLLSFLPLPIGLIPVSVLRFASGLGILTLCFFALPLFSMSILVKQQNDKIQRNDTATFVGKTSRQTVTLSSIIPNFLCRSFVHFHQEVFVR